MQKINARDWLFEASPITPDDTPTWVPVRNVESWTLSNSEGEETTDTTDFDSEGHAESQAMQRGASISIEGKMKLDPESGAPDPGQAVVNELAAEVGEASLGGFRFRHKSQPEWTVWTAWASKGDNSGGINDKTAWSASFTRSGKPAVEAVTAG